VAAEPQGTVDVGDAAASAPGAVEAADAAGVAGGEEARGEGELETADGTNPVATTSPVAEQAAAPVDETPELADGSGGGSGVDEPAHQAEPAWWSGATRAAERPAPPPPPVPLTQPTRQPTAVARREDPADGITRDHFGDLTLRPTGGAPIAEDFDAGPTELLDTTGEGLSWHRSPGQMAAGDGAGDWNEAVTDGARLPPPPDVSPPAPTDDEISGATRILTRPRLIERGNGDGNREHLLALGRTSIGRASDNLVHLLDEAVSRHHAEVVPGPQGYLLRDLGSENGIYVNGERTGEHLLHEGDVVQIGSRTLVFRSA
jgi:pSer/pThr/pTyr-binding forkhead associated (FHA) protein